MKGLLQRATTGVIFVLVMLLGLYGSEYSFVALFAIITGLCLWEYLTITLENPYLSHTGPKANGDVPKPGQKRDKLRKLIGLVIGLCPFIIVSMLKLNMLNSPESFVFYITLLCFPLIFLSFIYELFAQSKTPFANIGIILLGMVYIGTPFALLDFIAFDGETFHANVVFGLLLMTWANDTGAYMVGSQIGKTKLFPRISPKKTWEGSIGGGVVTLLISIALSYFFKACTPVQWSVLAIIVVIFGSIGDLVESMLKRSYQIKDSGSLLPGHGGLLDRFDAFIFLIPYAALYLVWLRG